MLCSIIVFGRFLGIDSTGISMLEVCEVISKKKPCLGHNCFLISEHVDDSDHGGTWVPDTDCFSERHSAKDITGKTMELFTFSA